MIRRYNNYPGGLFSHKQGTYMCYDDYTTELAKVQARLDVAVSALNTVSEMDLYDGAEMVDIVTTTLAKIRSMK